MKAVITDREALSAISTLAIHAYLKTQKWVRSDDLGDRGVVYQSPKDTEVFAPGSDRLADYAEAVSAVMAEIANVEGRDELAVYRDLVGADRDLIRFRAPEAADDGSIMLAIGVDLVLQSKEALLAVACSAAGARRFYRSGSNAKANDYLKTVRLGQTEQGSFVVTLLSPVPPQLESGQQGTLWPELETEPFSRQVTRTLTNAFDSLSSAIAEVGRGANIEAFERVVSRGVSANLCAAVSKFVSDGNGLDFSLTWARTRPSPESRHRATFASSDSPLLEEAAKMLKNREPLRNEVVEGYVKVLNRGEKATKGRVQLQTFVDGQPRSVAVDLSSELYKVALDAHDNRSTVRLEGDLEFEGQRWNLKSPRNIEIIEEKEAE
jgi:hypothetical protein